MNRLTRRSVLRGSLGLVAAGTLARPYLANAAAKTMELWWEQGYVQPEDVAIRKAVADFEKQSGNKVSLSIIPGHPLGQKIIAAVTSGVVPDAVWSAEPPRLVPLQAWPDHLVDVTDVVEPRKEHFTKAALEGAYTYNSVTKKRSYYGVPLDQGAVPFHIWGSLIEKAGAKRSDIPNTWSKFLAFFPQLQEPLRKRGMRHIYACGWDCSTSGNDPVNRERQWLIAYGGINIVTPDGKLHTDDPQVEEAAIKALEQVTTTFKDGYMPPSIVNWQDPGDNNAFHSKLVIADQDGTLSTEMAMIKKAPHDYWHNVITYGIPLGDDGKPIPNVVDGQYIVVLKGAKNVPAAKEFCKFMIEPKVNEAFVKGGLGRWLPVFPAQVKSDPFWIDPKTDPHRPVYVGMGFDSPTVPDWSVYNPAWSEVDEQHLLGVAFHDVVAGGMTPKAAIAKAFRGMEKVFARYKIDTA